MNLSDERPTCSWGRAALFRSRQWGFCGWWQLWHGEWLLRWRSWEKLLVGSWSVEGSVVISEESRTSEPMGWALHPCTGIVSIPWLVGKT